jgi:hypothetical protein
VALVRTADWVHETLVQTIRLYNAEEFAEIQWLFSWLMYLKRVYLPDIHFWIDQLHRFTYRCLEAVLCSGAEDDALIEAYL